MQPMVIEFENNWDLAFGGGVLFLVTFGKKSQYFELTLRKRRKFNLIATLLRVFPTRYDITQVSMSL